MPGPSLTGLKVFADSGAEDAFGQLTVGICKPKSYRDFDHFLVISKGFLRFSRDFMDNSYLGFKVIS